MKTGKGWIDIGKAGLADGFLENAVNSIEKLYAKLRSGSEGEADIQVHRADVEKSLFKVLSYQAESAVAQGDFQKAVMCVQRCKDMLMKLPKETCYLSILCYNFGVETYEWKRYEQKFNYFVFVFIFLFLYLFFCFQAKVLRLLATTYFEWDCSLYLDKALKAISLANQVVIFALFKIVIDETQCFVFCLALAEFTHFEMSLDFCLNTAKLLLEHGRESVGFDFLKSVPERFESSPDLGKITLLHIEFLLQNKRELLAKQKIEEVIIGHYTGKQLLPEALNQLHIILWDRAAKHYEEKNYSEALHWYNYSVSFYTPGQIDQNLAKLQRNMASCYFHLKQVDKAKEAVKQAERCDPNSIFTKFSVYKIAVMENDTDKVHRLGICSCFGVCFCLGFCCCFGLGFFVVKTCFNSFQNDQQIVAIKALEYLSEHLQDCRQLFTALKRVSNHLFTRKLLYMGKILITFSYFWCQLSQFCPSDKAVLIAQKTCLLMAAAIDLEMGRQVTPSEQTELFSQALQHLQTCKEIWKVLKLTGDFAKDPTDTLLLLYEFEARSKLNDPTLQNFMESVWEQPQIEIKTLEIIAALAMESPARYPVLCKKALRSALNLHRKQAVVDAEKFSKCLHSLVNISLPTGLTDLDTCVLQEVWDYFEDALSVISSTDAYPEMEILWLMTRAWNTGIFQYTVGKYKEAEQWCGLGMRFLNHLGSLKKSYEGHVSVHRGI
uniref:Protein ZIP4 homolog n=1 Tax=Ficedula albicollis TaxID=59894 RepID=U3KBS4_FICAL